MESNDKPVWDWGVGSNTSDWPFITKDGQDVDFDKVCEILNQFEDLKRENKELKQRIEKLLFQVAKEEQRTDNSARF